MSPALLALKFAYHEGTAEEQTFNSTLSLTSTLEGVGGQRHAPASLPRVRDPVLPIVQEAGWATGPVWTGAENLASTGIRSPERPARSESLYRLSYPARWMTQKKERMFYLWGQDDGV